MPRYSVTVKIVHTWYEEVVIEAASEDGAEVFALMEPVQETGEPIIDRYSYCNWVIEDKEPELIEDELDEELESVPVVENGEEVVHKKRTRRRRRSRGKSHVGDGVESTETTPPIAGDEETPALEEEPKTDEQTEEPAAPSRSRNRRRRGARPAEAVPVTEELHVGETETSTVEEVSETASEVETAATTRSRSRRRRRSPRSAVESPGVEGNEASTVETVSELVPEKEPTHAPVRWTSRPVSPRPEEVSGTEEQISAVETPIAVLPVEVVPVEVVPVQPAPVEVVTVEVVPQSVPVEVVAEPVVPKKTRTRRSPKSVVEAIVLPEPASPVTEESVVSDVERPSEAEVPAKPKPRRRRATPAKE